ncbi:MAG: c-type cytochrome [Gammaproteobacteria bacterium]
MSERAALLLLALLLGGEAAGDTEHRLRYALGRTATPATIAAVDIAIGPDGAELPPGAGGVAAGAALFAEHCAACHGSGGRGGPDPALVGGQGSLAGSDPVRTVGSYWPQATTLYDYIYRAMPFFAPGSLAPAEVYALTAFLLNANGIVADDAVMDRDSLPRVRMPNRHGFVPDPRPDTGGASAAAQGETP